MEAVSRDANDSSREPPLLPLLPMNYSGPFEPETAAFFGLLGVVPAALLCFYVNLVLNFALFKSTIMPISLRRVVRLALILNYFSTFFHVATYLMLSFIQNEWFLSSISGFFSSSLADFSLFLPPFIAIERLLYHSTFWMREMPKCKKNVTITVFFLVVSVVPTSVFLVDVLVHGRTDELRSKGILSFKHSTVIQLLSTITTIVPAIWMLIFLAVILLRSSRSMQLASGMVAQTRAQKLVEERYLLVHSVLPTSIWLFLTSALLSATPFLPLWSNRLNSLFISFAADSVAVLKALVTTLVLVRAAGFPLAFVAFYEDLRQDFITHLVVWKKHQRRYSETKVRQIYNTKEAQENVMRQLKMIGVFE